MHHVAGEDCYLVKVRVPDTDALGDAAAGALRPAQGVRNTRTTIVLSTVKDSQRLPLAPGGTEAAHDLTTPPPSGCSWSLAFAAIYLIWGSTYLGIALAIESMPPFLMAAPRFLLAGRCCTPGPVSPGAARPTAGRSGAGPSLLGVLFFLMGNGAVVWVEQRMPSGPHRADRGDGLGVDRAAGWLRPGGTRPSGVVLAGIGLGFVGVALLVLPGQAAGPVNPAGVGLLMCLAPSPGPLASVLSRDADLPESTALVSGMEMLCRRSLAAARRACVNGDWAAARSGRGHRQVVARLRLPDRCSGRWWPSPPLPGCCKSRPRPRCRPPGTSTRWWPCSSAGPSAGEQLSGRTLVASLVIVAAVVLIITGKELMPLPSKLGVGQGGAGWVAVSRPAAHGMRLIRLSCYATSI